MTVNVSKPALNVREKLAELDKPTGIAGEAMLRAETPQEQFNLIGAGRRNLLINGSVQVWQKGTSQTYTNGYKNGGPDHMTTYYGGTYTQQFATIPNKQYVSALRYTADSSTNASPNFNWIIEDGGKFLRNQVVTLGWWMRASKSGIDMAARVNNVVNSTYTGGGSNYALGVSSGFIYPATTEWSYHTRTIQLPSTFTHDHSLAEIWSASGSMDSGDWFEITQVQLELGKVATPFEHRSYGEELALCQRYYQYGQTRGGIPMYDSYGFYPPTQFNTSMRSAPSVSLTVQEFRPTGSGGETPASITPQNQRTDGFAVIVQASTNYQDQNGYGTYIWTADAEL